MFEKQSVKPIMKSELLHVNHLILLPKLLNLINYYDTV